MSMLQKLRTRRQFLHTGVMATAGSALLSCRAPQDQSSQRKDLPEETNLLRGLRQYVEDMNRDDPAHSYGFNDKDGNPVNLNALEAKLRGSDATVSWSWAGCDTICPYVNRNLSRLDESSKKKLTNIIISVEPGLDGVTAASRKNFENMLRKQYNIPDGFIILYPARDGVASAAAAEGVADPSNPLKARGIPKLSTRLGAPCNMNAPVQHSGDVLLYGPDGNFLAVQNGMADADTFLGGFAPYLGYGRQRSR